MRKFTIALCLAICAALVGGWADRRWGSYRLRFVDSATQQPIAGSTFLLVPRIILLDVAPGGSMEDPNLKYTKSITTDSNGDAMLKKSLIDELTLKGRVYVDSRSQGWARFCLRRNSPITFLAGDHITIFHSKGIVSHQVRLSGFHDNLLLLEKSSIPQASGTGN